MTATIWVGLLFYGIVGAAWIMVNMLEKGIAIVWRIVKGKDNA